MSKYVLHHTPRWQLFLRHVPIAWIVATPKVSTTHNLLYYLAMPSNIQLHDVVALMEDIDAKHLLTHEPLRLRRGQVGTVIMPLNDRHFQVEFADRDGRAYAMLPLSAHQLMILREEPEAIPA